MTRSSSSANRSTARLSAADPPCDRDGAILDTLVRRVRILSVAQIARTWWADSARPLVMAERRMASFAKRELIERVTLLARPEITLAAPLATWRSGVAPPDFSALAHQLLSRWRHAGPAQPTPCIRADVGIGRPARESEVTHDLHLAQVYLRFLREAPRRAATWVFESELAEPDEKLPDAMVREGRIKTAIELGGQYSAQKLAAFHDHCQDQGIGYEIW